MDNLNTYTSNEQLKNTNDTMDRIKKFLTFPKIIFGVLGIIVLVEIISAFGVLKQAPPPPPPPPPKQKVISTSAPKTPAKISLEASKKILKTGETATVSAVIDTGGNAINGVDLVVLYDPKILEINAAGIVKGNIFDEYPLKTVDVAKGVISISGISNSKNGYTGIGKFAVLTLKAKVVGKTSMTIEMVKKGGTTDSNLVEMTTSKDILEQVNNLELSVQ